MLDAAQGAVKSDCQIQRPGGPAFAGWVTRWPVKGEVVSGIAGIIRFDGAPVEAGQIAKITNALSLIHI